MKKKIALDQVKPGCTFTADALLDADSLFVPANVAVRQKDLDALKRWGISSVFTEGVLVDPNAPTSPEGLPLSPEETKASAAFQDRKLYVEYASLIDKLKLVFERLGRQEKVEPRTVDEIAQGTLQLVREKESAIVSAILAVDVRGYEYARAGINSAILSVVIGLTLKLPSHRLTQLATGALLHDVGMTRLPEEILQKKQLDPEDTQKIRAHPLISYRIVTRELQYPDDVGLMGLQHHERWDGEGYPRKTAGADIDILSRIVSVTDAFEAMVSEKPYRNSMIGYAAMKALLNDNSRRFDPEVLKAFIKSMGIYPIGSLVLLNNAAIARVVESHADAPLRPRIRLIVDEFGKHFKDETGDIVDLLTEKAQFIARAIDPRELVAKK